MNTDLIKYRIGFIGAGQMAKAIAKGLLSSGFTDSSSLIASDILPQAATSFQQETGATIAQANVEVWSESQIVILAVKPQHMLPVLSDAKLHATSDHLVISIAAGVSLRTMMNSLGIRHRLVRVMPNTPCLIGAGASAFSIAGAATKADAQLVQQMFSTVGLALELPEEQLDAVTGLSGSGPAYIFQMIEALSDGAVQSGLSRDVATQLAAQTVLGAAKMVLETKEHPAQLKDRVTSPQGTTIAGLYELEKGAVRASLMNAVRAATERSQELGQSL